MVCMSVILLCYRINAYDFVIKDFIIKNKFVLDPVGLVISRKKLSAKLRS